jgi:hypothetical protein
MHAFAAHAQASEVVAALDGIIKTELFSRVFYEANDVELDGLLTMPIGTCSAVHPHPLSHVLC